MEQRDKKGGIRFDGQVAIVTGAGSGLGRVYALELAKQGAKVVVNDMGCARDGSGKGSAGPADQVVAEIKSLGGEAVASYDSVTTAEGGEAIVNKAVETFGGVDILINNAGILRDSSFVKMLPEDWEQVLFVHLFGAYYVTRPAFIKMREKGYGRMVMTTSAAGLFGNFGQANYAAAKMGLVGLMNTLKDEGKRYNINVNTIMPLARTRMTVAIFPPDLLEKMKPEFVAPMVVYLCSQDCEETGMILNAGMGYFSRAAMVSGPGALVGDGKAIPTPEGVKRRMKEIMSMEGAREYFTAALALNPIMDTFGPKEETSERGD